MMKLTTHKKYSQNNNFFMQSMLKGNQEIDFFMEAIWCQNQTIDSTNISLCFIFDSLAINKIA